MEERFTPEMFLKHYTSQRDITVDEIGVAEIVIVSWGRSVIESLAKSLEAVPGEHWMYRESYLFYNGEVEGLPITLAQSPVGAPGTVIMMEEMIACGARVFLGLGWAGSLQASAPIGTFLLPRECLREEGTSQHYLDKTLPVAPDEQLMELVMSVASSEGLEVIADKHWTTDAPYRELREKIQRLGEDGVFGVDMETSAMYALGQFRGVRVCNLLVVSDELWQEWLPAFGSRQLEEATTHAQELILRCLEMGIRDRTLLEKDLL